MELKKIYVNDHEKGTIICEKCGKTRVVNLADFKNIGKPLKVKCGCGHFFFVRIEVRKFYRKSTHLRGEYIKISHEATKGLEKGAMTVEDLSRTGLRFSTKIPHDIRAADMLRVRFILDDAQQSEVHKSATAKWATNYFVGAEFVDFDTFNEANRTLGFYLMPR